MDAEFDKLVNKEHLRVIKFLHKAVIDVDENGTVAVAASREL